MQNHTMNKDLWITLFQEIGLGDEDMQKWHQLFETHSPDGHQSFLTWLGLPEGEIETIRKRFAA
ncbi:MAG: hypothetical protein HQL53_00380 [Magnetococcales bacterium]|nr:hypothetical protein [Magnetococcales bacterium]